MVIALWEQLNKDINNDLKQQILLMILESIINDDNSGLISQIAELTKYFLAKNKNYASMNMRFRWENTKMLTKNMQERSCQDGE